MFKARIRQVVCAGAVLAAATSAAEAGFTYVSQERSVYAVASDALAPGDPPAGNNAVEDSDSAGDFGTFTGDVQVEYLDPPSDLQTARATQNSSLRTDGIFADGLLRITSGDERAVARTRVHVDFDVNEATDYELAFTIDYEVFNTTNFEPQPGGVRLTRLVGGSEDAVLAERTVNKVEDVFSAGDEPFEFAQTGTLAPGQYRVEFDYSAANLASDGRDILEYDFSLRDVGAGGGNGGGGGEPNPIPLPPAAWAGLATFGGWWARRAIATRRRRNTGG